MVANLKNNMDDLWRQCAQWLIDTGVLPRQHKTKDPGAKIFDLAQTLRDGVVLCNLLNSIKPGAVDLSRINIRPQMLQFLCIQNLHTVVTSLHNVFEIPQYELFAPHDLYEMTNFRQVLRVLSILSHLPVSSKKFRPFPSDTPQTNHAHYEEEEDIYAPLEDLAAERELDDEDEDLYDTVPEEGIYGSVIDFKPPPASVPKDKRACCVNEILETERRYVSHLDMMQKKFIVPLRSVLNETNIKALFANTEQLYPVHKEFLDGIENAVNNNMSKMSAPFLRVKEGLLRYGVYCSNLQEALLHLGHIMQDEHMRMQIEDLQNQATPNKFKLRELLCVSMQRILKYHLLVRELLKQTSDDHVDKNDLKNASEAMQEVAQFINEVKRDSEMLQTINKVESCLTGYQKANPLSSYGRLLKDGELKVRSVADKKAQSRFTYLFDQALFMTNVKNDSVYKLTDLVRLEDFILDELNQTKGTKWSWSLTLRGKVGSQSYTLFAKTANDKAKWLENLNTAFENIRPSQLRGKDHAFKMKTFDSPTYCCVCNKLLQGCFFQGYICERTNKACHKSCLLEAWKKLDNGSSGAPSGSRLPPPPLELISSLIRTSRKGAPPVVKRPSHPNIQAQSLQLGTIYRANRNYSGQPRPPYGAAISFTIGEQVEMLEQVNADWWKGRTMSQYDRTGYFPASFVNPLNTASGIQRPKPPGNYMQSTPGAGASPTASSTTAPRFVPGGRLEDYDWFAGKCDRTDGENKLRGKPSGTFLVRSSAGHHAITLVFGVEIKHIKIFQNHHGYYVAECKSFSTLPELVQYYQSNMLSSSFFGLETTLVSPYRSRRPSVVPRPTPTLPRQGPLPSPQPSLPRPQPNPLSPTHRPNKIQLNGQFYDILGQGRVLYDFEPQSNQELGLREGQVVNIIGKPVGRHGWWKGEYQGRVGYFPAKYVNEM